MKAEEYFDENEPIGNYTNQGSKFYYKADCIKLMQDFAKQDNAELKKQIAHFAYWYENQQGNTDAFNMKEFEQILYPEFLKDYQKHKQDG